MAPHLPGPLLHKRLHLGLAIVLVALSAASLAGWALDLDELSPWSKTSAPFPPGAAASLLLLSIALVAIELNWRRASLLALVPAVYALVAGLRKDLPSGFALDDNGASGLLPAAPPLALTLSLLLAGATLPLLARRKTSPLTPRAIAFAGSLHIATGGSSLLGHLLELSAIYKWGAAIRLAPDAAILVLLLGLLLLSLAWRESRPDQASAPSWLPMPVVVICATLTLILWAGLRESENAHLGTRTQIAINTLATAIDAELDHASTAIERLARRSSQTPSIAPALWEADARIVQDDIPGCTAIVLLTPERRTQFVYPTRGNESLAAYDHNTDPARRDALDNSLRLLAPALSATHDIQAAGRGLSLWCPVVRDGQPAGYVGCEIPYRRFFATLCQKLKLSESYEIALSIGPDLVHQTAALSGSAPAQRLESVFSLHDRRLRIALTPANHYLQTIRRPIPEVALLSGLGLAALLGLSVHLARAARTRLREARLANVRLLAENDERRRVEEMLKISDERLRLALDSTQIGIFEWNLPANQLFYSSGVWTLLGYLPGVIPPTPEAWVALIHPDDLPAYKTIVENQLKGRAPFIEPEYRVRTADGSWRWLSARSRAVSRTPSGAPLRIIGTLQDVTERKKSEQALRESQAAARKLSFVASRTDNLVIIARPDGTIEWVNDSFERVMEFPHSEIEGRNPVTFMVGPETNPRTVRRIKAAMARGKGISTDIVNYSKSGKKFHIHLEIQPVRNEAGLLENFIGVMVDITARVETEQNLRRAKAEADAASRAKSEFLASMSHEIRTPMNGVIGMTSLLLDTKLSHEQRDYVSTIRTSGDALLTIINDILDFSKIESGKLELERHPFDLALCIEEALDLFSVAAAEKHLELTCHLDDAVPGWIVGDVTRLRQVLANLVNNAIKFTPAGSISIVVTRIGTPDTNPAVAKPLALEIAVSDTGIGIPADRTDRLFRPFSQVDSSTTRKYGGTGLGLAICQRLCSLMGGGIAVSSTPGVGSTFKFTLSTESVPTPPGWGLPEMPVQLNYGPLLCLDDHPVTQRRLETFFRSWGARAICAPTLAAAEIFLAGEQKPSAVILDYDLVKTREAAPLLAILLEKELPTLFLLPNAQTPAADIPPCEHFSAIAKPLRSLSIVRGIQALFHALPESTPPFAFSPAVGQHLLAHEIPLNILLVEDNPVNQKVALRFLDRLGYRADAVANGLEAVSTLEARRYNLILMDLQMPEMDGFEASRQIRKRIPLKEQPRIVALTANALSGDRERCLAAGMNDYISKPVKLHEIAEAIRRQFSGSRPPF